MGPPTVRLLADKFTHIYRSQASRRLSQLSAIAHMAARMVAQVEFLRHEHARPHSDRLRTTESVEELLHQLRSGLLATIFIPCTHSVSMGGNGDFEK